MTRATQVVNGLLGKIKALDLFAALPKRCSEREISAVNFCNWRGEMGTRQSNKRTTVWDRMQDSKR